MKQSSPLINIGKPRVENVDVDGDQLNVVAEKVIIDVAKRNIKEYDIVPLFYDAAKAPPEQVSKEAQFNGLKRAHQFSNIGEISNMLTRLWNRDNPDREVAALLTALNEKSFLYTVMYIE